MSSSVMTVPTLPTFPVGQTLALAVAMLAMCAVSLTAFGHRQRRYKGWTWWVAALWVTSAGVALALWSAEPAAAAVSGLLLMGWPVMTLIGLRRFHPRQALAGDERQDGALLATAGLLAVAGAMADPGAGPWLALGCSIVVHLYAAAIVFTGPGGREFSPAQGLAGVMALVAFAPGLSAFPDAELLSPLPARAAAAALGGLVLAFMAITLVCERTERQLRDSRRRLRTLANLDALTQVPNRRHFQELADQAMRQGEPGTAVLVSFDVDHFKRINDLFGHAAGDRALRLVSSAMMESLRAHDVPGRQGGDEFVLLLHRTTPSDAIRIAGRIMAEVQRRAPGQQLPTLSMSFGVVQIGFGEGVQSALRRADQAMYEAKRQGRSRAVTAEGDVDRPVFAASQQLGLTHA